MRRLYLDFETRSRVELRTVGVYRYAEDPSTVALSAAWALDDGGLVVWDHHAAEQAADSVLPMPAMTPALDAFLHYARNTDVLIVAHNAEFERLILKHVFKIDLPHSRFVDTAAKAARLGLPRSLDQLAQVLGLREQKDARGKRLIAKLCKPRRPSKSNPDEFWTPETAAEDYSDLLSYNAQDVVVLRELDKLLPDLSPREQLLWELTQKMNERGLRVDTESVPLAIEAAVEETHHLTERFVKLTGVSPASRDAAPALGMESLAKAAVRAELKRPDLSPRVVEALLLRQRIAKTSVKKLVALQNRVSVDGRLRGNLVYGGAERTQRWSGSGVQLQNLPRGLGEDTDRAFELLHGGALHLGYKDVLSTLSEMLKGFFTGPFLVGDYAQIEARMLAWLAGQADLSAAFLKGEDVYCQMASAIYGTPITKADHDDALNIPKRQLGKIAVLGCGYGLGAARFQAQMEEQFDVKVSDETAERVIRAYRRKYPRVPLFWSNVETMFRVAVRDGQPGQQLIHPDLPGLRFGRLNVKHLPFAWVALPSGRALFYFDPKLEDGELTYFGRDIFRGGKWGRVKTYGGKLTENIVQATARDVMAEAMIRLDAQGYPLVLTVHDEIVAEGTDAGLEAFRQLMLLQPSWAEGLPLAAEAFATGRYRK